MANSYRDALMAGFAARAIPEEAERDAIAQQEHDSVDSFSSEEAERDAIAQQEYDSVDSFSSEEAEAVEAVESFESEVPNSSETDLMALVHEFDLVVDFDASDMTMSVEDIHPDPSYQEMLMQQTGIPASEYHDDDDDAEEDEQWDDLQCVPATPVGSKRPRPSASEENGKASEKTDSSRTSGSGDEMMRDETPLQRLRTSELKEADEAAPASAAPGQ